MARKQDITQFQGADSVPAKLSIIVGENLRQLRRKHGLSLEQLAHISGVSRAMLGQIETGKSAPTINLLGRIAEALKVSVPSLISNPGVGGTVIVPRDRATVLSSSEGGFISRALFPWGDPQSAEIYEVTIAPHHSETVTAHAAGAKKTLVVLSGDLDVTVGEDSPARLSEGDVILFNADTPHRFHNPGEKEAKAFLVVTGIDGTTPRPRAV
jgi:transcriptional regulator with XRE-family HTH domain